jgi:hypothetical protein
MKRCFVISPIGHEGSEARADSDEVYDLIIRPAMEETGIQAVRSDHLPEPGRISEQMVREILGDDLCIAVLTGHNPNVFYELAIAQAAAKPVIALLQKGQSLPFDIKDLRCVTYDLRPRAWVDKTYVKEVVAQIKSLEKDGWKVRVPFADCSPLALSRRSQWPPDMLPADQLVQLERAAREASDDYIRFACAHTLWSSRPDRAKVVLEGAQGDWRDYVKRHAELLLHRYY